MSMINKYPPFSVLMSVYIKENPNYFDQSLKSIEQQTILPNEVILVEDGPLTSELYEVVDKHKLIWNNKLKIVKRAHNGGLGSALRMGTKHVSTDWIARMDTDDISVPDRFETQLKEIVNHPNYAVIGGQVDEFTGTPDNKVGSRQVPQKKEDIYNYIKYRNPFNHPTVMINKNKLLAVGGYKSTDRLEDYNLWVQFVKNKQEVVNLDKVLVHMRVNDNLYQRRGGFRYLRNYMRMKKKWHKQGTGTYKSVFISDASMIANTIMPEKFRKYLYQNFLHKK